MELWKSLDDVGVIGLVGWLELSESFADESFVRFFFRNPSDCFICGFRQRSFSRRARLGKSVKSMSCYERSGSATKTKV